MGLSVVDGVVEPIANGSGLHPDLVRMALCLIGSYPFCAVLKRLPDDRRQLKDVYIITIALFYLVGVFSLWAGLRTLLISIGVTYATTKYLRENPFMPWIVFLFVMGHLFTSHVEAQWYQMDYEASLSDITGAQMVLCMKLTAFAWNVYDGTLADNVISDFQKERRVKEQPKLLDFLAYCLFFPSLLTGPSYDYREFEQWIDLSMFDITTNEERKQRKNRAIPRSGRIATRKLVEGLLWIGLWTQSANYIYSEYAQSAKFMDHLFVLRVIYLYLLGFTYRLKYYGAWTISEGACILSGLGFNGRGKNGKYRWDRVKNVSPWKIETAQNTYIYLGAWNMNTSAWLKNYVYLRVTPRGRKPGFRSTLATFVTSALWHGTRPGYYLTFVTGAFYQSLGKLFRRNFRPIFIRSDGAPGKYKPYYDAVCLIVTQVSFGYICHPFVLLDLKASLDMWKTVYFFIHVIIAVVLFLFHGPFKKSVTGYLKSLQPKPLKASDQVKSDTQRLKEMRKEIEQLSSPAALGVPQPDFEHFDDDLQEAIAEFEQLKEDLSVEIQNLKKYQQEKHSENATKKNN